MTITTDDRIRFTITHAAELVLVEVENQGKFDDPLVNAVHFTGVELLCCLLDEDARPAKAVLDAEIARLHGFTWNKTPASFAPPAPGTALTFDQVEAHNLDATGRSN